MIKISKKAQYGLRAMVALAKSRKVISLREVSNVEGIPYTFLEKIITTLEKEGLLKSKKGSLGGYYLSKSAGKITVGQIVNILEGNTAPVNCDLCKRAKKCLSKNVWQKVQISLNNTMNSITLAELIR